MPQAKGTKPNPVEWVEVKAHQLSRALRNVKIVRTVCAGNAKQWYDARGVVAKQKTFKRSKQTLIRNHLQFSMGGEEETASA